MREGGILKDVIPLGVLVVKEKKKIALKGGLLNYNIN